MIRLLVLLVLCGAASAKEQNVEQTFAEAADVIRNIDTDAAMKNVAKGGKLAMSTLEKFKDIIPDQETAAPLVEDGLKLLNKGIKVAQDQAFKNPQVVQDGLELMLSKPALFKVAQNMVTQIIRLVKSTSVSEPETVVDDIKKAVESIRAEEMLELVEPIANLLEEGSEVLANHKTEIEEMLKELARDDELFDTATDMMVYVVDGLYASGKMDQIVEEFGGMAIEGTTMVKDLLGKENGPKAAALVRETITDASAWIGKLLVEEPNVYVQYISLVNQYPELFAKLVSAALQMQSNL